MSAAALLWGLLFGSLGAGYLVYGRKQRAAIPALCGLALIVVPYFLSNAWLLVAVGAVLAAVPFIVGR